MSASKGLMQAASGVSTGDGVGDAWNISTAQWLPEDLNYFYTSTVFPVGVFFKTDGSKMYVLSSSSDDAVYEYDLSTNWDASTASYLQNFSVASQESGPLGFFFKPDGTKMYVSGLGTDAVTEYDLSTAWDISSASYLQNFSVASQDTVPHGLFFKNDGTKMYTLGNDNDSVYEYNLSTAWDVSSASYLQSFSVVSQDNDMGDLSFKSDGTKMYVVAKQNDNIYEYNLSTAWDISSASYSQAFDISFLTGGPEGLFFKPDGLQVYVAETSADSVYQLQLSTAWDVSSASYQEPTTKYFEEPEGSSIRGLGFKTDGTKMFALGYASRRVYEYDLSTEWDLSSASFSQELLVFSQSPAPTGIFFKPDGLAMYTCCRDDDEVNEYSLSTAWDISSASFVRNFDISTQEASSTDLFFKPDGTKMYILGSNGDDVNEYNLSTAWDISSASYSQNFSVASQDTSPAGLFFKPDGLVMFVAGTSGDDILQYDLSTAWDISSASYVQNFVVRPEILSPEAVFFRADGLKMYIPDDTSNAIYEYDL